MDPYIPSFIFTVVKVNNHNCRWEWVILEYFNKYVFPDWNTFPEGLKLLLNFNLSENS